MSRLLNIGQSKKDKEKFKHPIVDILLKRATKQDVAEVLHVSERKARDIIAECSMHYPVIARSDQKGYRRARAIDDLTLEELELEYQDVQITAREINSRIKCLRKRLKPLIAWMKMADKKRGKH